MGATIIGRTKIVRKILIPRTGFSSKRASPIPSVISTLIEISTKAIVMPTEVQTWGLESDVVKASKPTKRALSHGVPMPQSKKLSLVASMIG
jgi:hypothetical protein